MPTCTPILPAMIDIGASSGRSPLSQFDGLEGDAGQADVEQAPGQLRQRREVQVAEQQVILAQQREVALDRLLDLDDQFALLVQRGGIRRDLHAELGVVARP